MTFCCIMVAMMTVREILTSIMTADKPQKIVIDSVSPNGDVVFHVTLKDCGLDKSICEGTTASKRFLVNFLGEFFVRENIVKFAKILWGLDPALERKMLYSANHQDFGMVVDNKMSKIIFQMHLSLVREITTELFGEDNNVDHPDGLIIDDFDASNPDFFPPCDEEQSSEEE